MRSVNDAWLLIGNPENRRLRLFRQALARRDADNVSVLSYERLLENSALLEQRFSTALSTIDADRISIRIDSPGENAAVEQGLIRLGYEVAPQAPLQCATELGEIADLRYWYRGFCQLLAQLKAAVSSADREGRRIRFMNQPDDIALMFDKQKTQAQLLRQGVPVIPALPAFTHHRQLRHYMLDQHCYRVFVKPRYGSSASGVIAYEIHPDGKRESASTAIELVHQNGETRLFNSLKPRRYHCPDEISQLMKPLFCQDVHIERWLPKSRIGRRSYDLRVMAIGGCPAQSVVRKSKTPLTNLHLGNARGNLQELGWDQTRIERLEACVTATAAAFPDTHHMGIDLLLPRSSQQPRVIEVNAFGDLLPDILYQGQDTYGLEIDRWRQRAQP